MTTTARTPSHVWRRLTVGALLGMTLTHLWATVLVQGEYARFALIIIDVPLLALAVWVATGARWAAPAATAITALLAVSSAVGAGSRLTELDGGEVLAAAMFIGFALLAVVAGTATAVRSKSGPRRVGI